MHKTRALIVVALLAVLSVAVWYVLGEWGGGSSADRTADRGDVASGPAASLLSGDGPTPDEASIARSAIEGVDSAKAKAASGAAVSGQVVGPDHRPLAGALVTCGEPFFRGWGGDDGDDSDVVDNAEALLRRAATVAAMRVETITDADGRFELVPRNDGVRVEIWAEARGFVARNRVVPRPKESPRDLGTIELAPGGIVSGRVVDATGRPVADAKVRRAGNDELLAAFVLEGADALSVRSLGMEEATTDADGRFELQHVPAGTFALHASHAKHPLARVGDLRVAAGATLADVLVQFGPVAAISGRVVDLPADTAALCVRALRRDPAAAGRQGQDFGRMRAEMTVDVAADGTFALTPLLGGGDYEVWLAERIRAWPRFATASRVVQVRAGASGIELRFEAGVGVSFTVVDARSGQPVERLWIMANLRDGNGWGWDAPRLGDYPQGKVTIGSLRPQAKQTLTLRVDGLGYSRFERANIELPLSGTVDLGTVRLEPAPVVRVHVVAGDGEPVRAATVRVRKESNGPGDPFALFMTGATRGPRAGRSDDEGRCVVNADLDVDSELVVQHGEFAPYESEPFKVGPEGADREVRLLRGGSVAVEVVDDRGQPLAKATVMHKGQGADAVPNNLETDPQGRVLFERLPPGDHGFRLRDGGEGMQIMFNGSNVVLGGADSKQGSWETVAVVDQERATLRLSKAPPALLSGVVRENGVPLAHAKVAFRRGKGGGDLGGLQGFFGGAGETKRAETDAEGRYALEGLVAGEHRLSLTHDDRAMATSVPVTLSTGANVVDVDLDVTSVRGTVRGTDGKPIAKASVRVRRGAGDDNGPGLQFAFTDASGNRIGMGGGGGQRAVETDADGAFVVRGVAAGASLFLDVSADDYVNGKSEPFEVARGATKTGVDLILAPAGRIHVRVATADRGGVQARLLGAEERRGPAHGQLRKGEATLSGLQPGRWSVTINLGPDSPLTREVDVVAGRTTQVEF